MEKPSTVVVAAIIVDDEKRILINQRPVGSALAGFWEFPGGKVEAGEDPRDALVRECHEELGCTVEVGSVYETIFHRTADRTFLLLFYRARIIDGEPKPLENNPIKWVTLEELADYELLEADKVLPLWFRNHFPTFEMRSKS